MQNSIYETVLKQIKDGDVVLLGARPGMGKTSFALGLATAKAENSSEKVYIFELEMTRESTALRIKNRVTDGSQNLRCQYTQSKFDDPNMNYEELCSESIIIDTSAFTTEMIESKISSQRDLGLIIIDYLELIGCETNYIARLQAANNILKKLKSMAIKYKVPIFCCTQLSRAIEERKNPRPKIEDVCGDTNSASYADMVMFLFRESYYGGDIMDCDQTAVELIIAKNNNGDCGSYQMKWDGQYMKLWGMIQQTDNNSESVQSLL